MTVSFILFLTVYMHQLRVVSPRGPLIREEEALTSTRWFFTVSPYLSILASSPLVLDFHAEGNSWKYDQPHCTCSISLRVISYQCYLDSGFGYLHCLPIWNSGVNQGIGLALNDTQKLGFRVYNNYNTPAPPSEIALGLSHKYGRPNTFIRNGFTSSVFTSASW